MSIEDITIQLDFVFHEPLPVLAEHTDTDPDLVRELIRPFHDQYPELAPGSGQRTERLALALTRFWR